MITRFLAKNKIIRKFVVTEGIESTWHYHISLEDKPTRSLCGVRTMRTNLPMKSWGIVTEHIKEKYCNECRKLMNDLRN
jgi:hypothetical protein